MSILNVENLHFSYGDNNLFSNASMRLLLEDRMGLVGLNGSGKSTFLNIIALRLSQDEGSVNWVNGVSFSYLDQHLKIDNYITIIDYVSSLYAKLYEAEKEKQCLYEKLDEDYEKKMNKAENIEHFLEISGFYEIDIKIDNILNGLGLYNKYRLLSELSGGEKSKVYFAKMLLEGTSVLLLDEPTNFLDAVHIKWLIDYLKTYKNPYIIVSHDTHFLNEVTNCILAIENKKIKRFTGNYEAYIINKKLNDEAYYNAYLSQKKFIKTTQDFINKNITRASTSKRAKSRRKMLEKIEVLDRPTKEKEIHFEFVFTKSFDNFVLECDKLCFGYDVALLKPFNFKMRFGEKIVILGKNGIGKTTFIKTILGLIPTISGKYKMSIYNDVLYYPQEEGINNITPIEYIQSSYKKLDNNSVRSILAKVGIIGDLTLKPMRLLSGGEMSKVRFALCMLKNANLLVLDEPTSHLDKNAKEALLNALLSFPGSVIMISHEKYFYKKMGFKEVYFA